MLALVLAVASLAASPAASSPRVTHFRLHSHYAHATLRETLVQPRGGGPRPLLVFLHGRGMTEDSSLNRQMLGALSGLGADAPDIVFPDGGDHSYWHDRPGDRAFIAALRSGGLRVHVHRWPGGHTGSYWRSHWGSYLGFYARALAHCGTSGRP